MFRISILREFGFPVVGLCLTWGVLVVAGLMVLMQYESRPGENPGQSPAWPFDSSVRASTNLPTVVVFAHPHCPCTRASIAELGRVHSICHEMAEFRFVAFEPLDADEHWRTSDLVESARAIPGVEIYWDRDGAEARRFNVQTSGHVLMFDTTGQLRFTGGVTSSRGHEGANDGSEQLVSWLRMASEGRKGKTELLDSPVFGCAMIDGSEIACNE